MAKLFITPLGNSCRKKFCEELQEIEYGIGAIVLPNRIVMDDVRKSMPMLRLLVLILWLPRY